MRSEEFFYRMVEALGIIIDRRPKGKPCKMEIKDFPKLPSATSFIRDMLSAIALKREYI